MNPDLDSVVASQSIPEAYNAAPRATAVIGSMLVSTFGVICSRSICLSTGEYVGPPTRIRVSNLPARLFLLISCLHMSIAFWKIGATTGLSCSSVMIISSSNSFPSSSSPNSSNCDVMSHLGLNDS